jgi:hypothetical protein
MKGPKPRSTIDWALFLISLGTLLVALVWFDDEFLAALAGLVAFCVLSIVYCTLALATGLPRMRLHDFIAALIAMLP